MIKSAGGDVGHDTTGDRIGHGHKTKPKKTKRSPQVTILGDNTH